MADTDHPSPPRAMSSVFNSAPEHAQALGLVTANFSLLEQFASTQIGGLLGLGNAYGEVVTAEMSFKAKCDLLGALARARIVNGAKLGALVAIIAEMATVEQERNTLIHSRWESGNGGGTLARVKVTAKRGKGLNEQREFLRSDDLFAAADRIAKVTAKLAFFRLVPTDVVNQGRMDQEMPI